MRRLVLIVLPIAALLTGSFSAAAAPPAPRVLDCSGKPLVRPAGFVVLACADGNALFRRTQWRSWTRARAVGVTEFGLNLCEPSCAASRMSFFPHSRVVLTGVKRTASGLVFTRASVTYVLHGTTRTFVAELPTRPLV